MRNPKLIEELRRQFNDLVDALDAEGVCTSRECMCDTSAPIVKMNATISQLESYCDTLKSGPASANTQAALPQG
jgi:hypothetical protein